MNPTNPTFESFIADAPLREWLTTTAADRGLRDVSIGLLANDRRLFAGVGSGGQPQAGAAAHLVPAGCLAKVITATLVAEAVAAGRLTWEARVSDLLVANGVPTEALADVTLGQLLDHTHGLDASAMDEPPRTSAGWLNWTELCSQLGAPSLAAPGAFHSYSNVGPWLAAAVLERIYGIRYDQLLRRSSVFVVDAVEPSSICPAGGGGLAASVAVWLTFLESHFHSHAALRAHSVSLPGWNPTEAAACLGWKSYGGGWFGHNSNLAETSALLRFNPAQRIAIVLAAPAQAAFFALAAVFGHLLPEFVRLVPPRLLRPHEVASLELAAYPGTYARARDAIEIQMTQSGALSFSRRGRQPRAEIPVHALRAAQQGLFMPEPRDLPEFAFVQFVSVGRPAEMEYLWNGRQLWRRR